MLCYNYSNTHGDTKTYKNEFIQAAYTHIGEPALIHQRFAGNCLEKPSVACISAGLDSGGFDCSGLIIKLASEVSGIELVDWASRLRHVRDMWADAESEESVFRMDGLAVGSLVVTRRTYHVGNQKLRVPGHIGLITETIPTPRILHTSSRTGKVEERPMRSLNTVLGYITTL